MRASIVLLPRLVRFRDAPGYLGMDRGTWFFTLMSGLRCSFGSPERLRYAMRNEADEPRAEELVEELQARLATAARKVEPPEDTENRIAEEVMRDRRAARKFDAEPIPGTGFDPCADGHDWRARVSANDDDYSSCNRCGAHRSSMEWCEANGCETQFSGDECPSCGWTR